MTSWISYFLGIVTDESMDNPISYNKWYYVSVTDKISFGEVLFNSLQKYSEKILLYDGDHDEAIKYSEILSQSIRIALKLRERGIKRNDIVSTCTHNQKYSCVPIVAAQFLGAINASFDPSLSHLDTVHLLKRMEPKIVFVSEEALTFFEKCVEESGVTTELVVFGSSTKYSKFSEFLLPDAGEQIFTPVKIDNVKDTAVIFFSSGTTGLPKGICLSHESLINSTKNMNQFYISKRGPVVSMMFTTFYWISAIFNFSSTVRGGVSTLFCKKFDPVLTWRLFEKYKVTYTFLAPYNALACLKVKPKDVDVSSLQIVITGSCPVNEKLMRDLIEAFPNARILNVYGQTEFSQMLCYFDIESEEEYKMQLLKPLSVGKIRNDTEWKIVDINSEEVLGPNQEGELRIKTNYLMSGYYKMDSSDAFDSEGFLKTGDIAYYDEDNCIFIAERIKEMFKYRGWHILPAIVENVVKSHPAVKEAAVIGIPDEEDGDRPMAVVVLFEDCADTKETEILNFVNERVADHQKLRAGVKIVEYIPKTVTGKMIRRDIRKMILEQMNGHLNDHTTF